MSFRPLPKKGGNAAANDLPLLTGLSIKSLHAPASAPAEGSGEAKGGPVGVQQGTRSGSVTTSDDVTDKTSKWKQASASTGIAPFRHCSESSESAKGREGVGRGSVTTGIAPFRRSVQSGSLAVEEKAPPLEQVETKSVSRLEQVDTQSESLHTALSELTLGPERARLNPAAMGVVLAMGQGDRDTPPDIVRYWNSANLGWWKNQRYADGHWHVWGMKPWFQVRYNKMPDDDMDAKKRKRGLGEKGNILKSVGPRASQKGQGLLFEPSAPGWERRPATMRDLDAETADQDGRPRGVDQHCPPLTEPAEWVPTALKVDHAGDVVPGEAMDNVWPFTLEDFSGITGGWAPGTGADGEGPTVTPGVQRRLYFPWMGEDIGTDEYTSAQYLSGATGVVLPWTKHGLPVRRQSGNTREPVQVVYPEQPARGDLPEDFGTTLAYLTSRSGTNQPKECYIYSLSDDFKLKTGPFAPTAEQKAQNDADDAAAAAEGIDVNDVETIRLLLKTVGPSGRAKRTPRTLAEEQMWHLDTRGGKQEANPGCLKKWVYPTVHSEAPHGLPRTQRFRSRRGVGGAYSTNAQNINYLYGHYRERDADKPFSLAAAYPNGFMRKNLFHEDVKVIMVDIGHVLANPGADGWRLFQDYVDDSGNLGILPAYEQREARKVQVHTLRGGIDEDAATGNARAKAKQIADAKEAAKKPLIAAVKERVRAAKTKAKDDMNKAGTSDANRQERLNEIEEAGEEEIARLVLDRGRPETLEDLIWRTRGIEPIEDLGTTRTATSAQEAAYNAWRGEKMAPDGGNFHSVNAAGNFQKTQEDKKQGLIVAADVASTWPLLRTTPVPPIAGSNPATNAGDKRHNVFVASDTGVDISTIPTGGEEPRLLDPDEIHKLTGKFEVVTFASVQGSVPTAAWEEYLPPKEVTATTIDKYNRWAYGGKDGNGGVPCFWKMSNLEDHTEINKGADADNASVGVAKRFEGLRGAVQTYDNELADWNVRMDAYKQYEREQETYPLFNDALAKYAKWYDSQEAASYQGAGGIAPKRVQVQDGQDFMLLSPAEWTVLEFTETRNTSTWTAGTGSLDEGYRYPPRPPPARTKPVEPQNPGDKPVEPVVQDLAMTRGAKGAQGSTDLWRSVGVGTLRDRAMAPILNMITTSGIPPADGADPGLKRFPFIQTFLPARKDVDSSDLKHGNKQNNCFIVPYALYDREEYNRASRGSPAEVQRKAARDQAAAIAAAAEKEMLDNQVFLAAEQKAADDARASQLETERQQKDAALKKARDFKAARKRVAKWRARKTVTAKGAVKALQRLAADWSDDEDVDISNPFEGLYPDEVNLSRDMHDSVRGTTVRAGSCIRDLTDSTWWSGYRNCKPGFDTPPYPNPSFSDQAAENLYGLGGNQFSQNWGGNGVRWENEEVFKARLDAWEKEPNKTLKLPWEPERHEASYSLYAKLANEHEQHKCTYGKSLVGDRPFENMSAYEQRKKLWIGPAGQQNAGRARDAACASQRQTREEWKKQAAEKAAREAAAARQDPTKRQAAERAAREAAREAAKEENAKKVAEVEAEAKAAAEEAREREMAEAMASDEDDVGDRLFGDEDSSDDNEPDAMETDSSASIGQSEDTVVDGVHWIVLGGIGLGSPDAKDTLRVALAAASKERFQSAWAEANADERRAMIVLRAQGHKIMKERELSELQ
jgi:hypothetical protein